MSDAIVGSVGVDVVPNVKNWNKTLGPQVEAEAEKAGRQAGEKMGDGLREGLEERTKDLPTPEVKPQLDEAAMTKIRAQLDELASKTENASFGLDDKKASAQILDIRAKLLDLGQKTSDPKIDIVGLAKAESTIAKLDLSLDAVGKKRETANVKVKVDESGLDKAFAKIKGQKGFDVTPSFGGAGALIGAGIATLGPAIVGLGATALPVIGALTAGMTAAGLGAGAFAAVAVPAFTKVKTAATALSTAQKNYDLATTSAQRASALKAETAATYGMSTSQIGAVKAYSALTSAVTKWQNSLDPTVFPVMEQGFSLLTSLLPTLTPFVTATASAFTELLGEAKQSLGSPLWKSFFGFLSGSAHDSIVSFGHDIGNIVTGFVGLMTAFGPTISGVERGIESITSKFANFGIRSSVGASGAFNSFEHFVTDIAPNVEHTLGVLGKAIGGILVGLAPSVKPALSAIDSIVGALTPILGAIMAALPGVLSDVSNAVKDLTPLAKTFGAAFSATIAGTIHQIASAIHSLVGYLDGINPSIVRDLGTALGIVVAAIAINKVTGAAKLATGIGQIGAAAGKWTAVAFGFAGAETAVTDAASAEGLAGVAGGIEGAGIKAGEAAGPMSKFVGAAKGLASAAGWGAALAILSQQVQSFAYKTAPSLKTIDDTAKKQGSSGYWDLAKAGVKSYTDSFSSDFAHANSKVLDLLTGGHKSAEKTFIPIQAKDEASPVITKVNAGIDNYAKKHPDVALTAKDQTETPAAAAVKHLNLFTHHPSSVLLTATDKAAGPVGDAVRHLQYFTGTPSGVNLKANDEASGSINSVRSNLDSLNGKTATTHLRNVIETEHINNVINYMTNAGKAPHRAAGGPIVGPGGPTSDQVPIMGSDGEWVVKASRVKELGAGFMDWVNNGTGTAIPSGVGASAPAKAGNSGSQTITVELDRKVLAKAVREQNNSDVRIKVR